MKRPGNRKHGSKKVLGLVMVVGLITAGTYAFTNSNTVQANNAGDGQATVSGYTVSNLDYNETVGLDTDPSTVETVDFRLSGAADRVRIQLADGTTDKNGDGTNGPATWFDTCIVDAADLGVVTPATAWTCDVSGYLAAEVTKFRVVAYEDENTIIVAP